MTFWQKGPQGKQSFHHWSLANVSMPFVLPAYAGDFRSGLGACYSCAPDGSVHPDRMLVGSTRPQIQFVPEGNIYYVPSPTSWHDVPLYSQSTVKVAGKRASTTIKWRQSSHGAGPFHPLEKGGGEHAKRIFAACKLGKELGQKDIEKSVFPGCFHPYLSSMKTSAKVVTPKCSFMEELLKHGAGVTDGAHFPPSLRCLNSEPVCLSV